MEIEEVRKLISKGNKMGTSPAKFVEQVKQEASRVTWPTRKETLITTGMVLFMVVLASLFFLFIDWAASGIIGKILGI